MYQTWEQRRAAMTLEEKIKWYDRAIAYEKASGKHTYHQCSCGKHPTRAGLCFACLKEEQDALSFKES